MMKNPIRESPEPGVRPHTNAAGAAAWAVALTLLLPLPGNAQGVLSRTPNLSAGWVGEVGTLHFNFMHRFQASDAPRRKVSNSPNFLIGYGLPLSALVGVNYATNSPVADGVPNEWEAFGRIRALSQSSGALDLSLQAGYNAAAASVDGEVSLGRDIGRLTLLATGRFFSDGYHEGRSRGAVGGGGVLRLTRNVALAADYTTLLDLEDSENAAWGVGLQLGVPYTPHTFSLQVSNAPTGTLQGTSRGGTETLIGFEFTIPFRVSRYFGRGGGRSTDPSPADSGELTPLADGTGERAPTVVVSIRDFAFSPTPLRIAAGTTVVWVNDDAVGHTATADDGGWDSGDIQPGFRWSRTFNQPGSYDFHCTPHPFMTGMVHVVEEVT